MGTSIIYFSWGIISLGTIGYFIIGRKPKQPQKRLSPLAVLSFALVIAGIFLGDEPWLGYGLMAMGVLLSIADMLTKYQPRQPV